MQLRKTILLAVLVTGLVAAAPAAAHRGGSGSDRAAAQGHPGGNVPSRVATRLKRANSALDRASGYADDGDSAKAVAALGSVNRNLASALRSAKRRVGQSNGPDALAAVASVQDDVITTTTGMFDGADGDLVTALAGTLDGAIDGRDEAIASIAALSASDQAGYAGVLDAIDSDVTDELDNIDQSLQDDGAALRPPRLAPLSWISGSYDPKVRTAVDDAAQRRAVSRRVGSLDRAPAGDLASPKAL